MGEWHIIIGYNFDPIFYCVISNCRFVEGIINPIVHGVGIN